MSQIICSICREACAIENSERLKALQCGHVFHTNCIVTWAHMSATCPHCRAAFDLSSSYTLYFEHDSGLTLVEIERQKLMQTNLQLREQLDKESQNNQHLSHELVQYKRLATLRQQQMRELQVQLSKTQHSVEFFRNQADDATLRAEILMRENIALIGDPTISDVECVEELSCSSSKKLLCSFMMKYRKVSSRLEALSELNNIFRNQLDESEKIIRYYQRQFLDSRNLMISDLDPSSNVDQQVTEGSMRYFPAGPSSENIPPIEVSSIGNSYSDIHHQASSSSQAPTFQYPRRKRRSSPISPETRNNYKTHRHNFTSNPRQLVIPHVTVLLDNRSPELKEYRFVRSRVIIKKD